jgi:hypothetical protein
MSEGVLGSSKKGSGRLGKGVPRDSISLPLIFLLFFYFLETF